MTREGVIDYPKCRCIGYRGAQFAQAGLVACGCAPWGGAVRLVAFQISEDSRDAFSAEKHLGDVASIDIVSAMIAPEVQYD